jgi:hypothetical protein
MKTRAETLLQKHHRLMMMMASRLVVERAMVSKNYYTCNFSCINTKMYS